MYGHGCCWRLQNPESAIVAKGDGFGGDAGAGKEYGDDDVKKVGGG